MFDEANDVTPLNKLQVKDDAVYNQIIGSLEFSVRIFLEWLAYLFSRLVRPSVMIIELFGVIKLTFTSYLPWTTRGDCT